MTPTSKVRMGPTSWPRRHLSRSLVWSINIVTPVTICTNGNRFPFGSLSTASVTAAIRSSWMSQPSSWICRDRPHRPRPVSMDNRIGQSTSPQRRLRRKLQLLDTWIIMLTVLYSYGHFAVTIDDECVCKLT